MTIRNLFSKRRKRDLGQMPDTVTYEPFPTEFRTQLNYLVGDLLRRASRTGADLYGMNPGSEGTYAHVAYALRREYGVFALAGSEDDPVEDLHAFIQREPNVDRVLDVIEMAVTVSREDEGRYFPPGHTDTIIDELNQRFNEHALGYQFESSVDRIVRTDSKMLHEEVVRPALAVLSDPHFSGANDEMIQALEHHRRGREKDALTWALKALESSLKIICSQRRWAVQGRGQAKDLLDTVFQNNLIEPIWQSEFASLRSVLESGVPTGRNKLGSHGQGSQPITVPKYLGAFVLHQTAAAILFLVEANNAQA